MATPSNRSRSISGRRRPSAGHSPPPSAAAFASSTASNFSVARSPSFFTRSASPTGLTSSSSLRFDSRPTSPGRGGLSFAGDKKAPIAAGAMRRRTCACSPTTHPGSYRCGLHKGMQGGGGGGGRHSMSTSSSRLNARRSAMTNSLVRIGTVEGELMKRALAALVRPCAHQQRRRAAFQPRPSRLSIMSKAGVGDDQ